MIINSKPIEQLEAEAKVDLVLRLDKTAEDSANTPILFNKYHKEYRLVKTEFIRAGNSLLRLRRKKWFWYSGKAKPEMYEKEPLDFKYEKVEVKMLIDSDDDVIKATYLVEMLDMKKNYIKEKIREINNRSYLIGNIIKTIHFETGIN